MVATNPNEADFTPPTSIVDLSLQKGFTLGGGYGLNVSFDVLNALNEDAPNRFGVSQGDYGRVYGLVQPRIYRAGIKFLF
jgi:outer membrane receptor protein involved in Fe transport